MNSTTPPGSLATGTGADLDLPSLGLGLCCGASSSYKNLSANGPRGRHLGHDEPKGPNYTSFLHPWALWRGEGLAWPVTRGHLATKSKSEFSPDPSATCQEIPHSHLPAPCKVGVWRFRHTLETSAPQVAKEVVRKREIWTGVSPHWCQNGLGSGGWSLWRL